MKKIINKFSLLVVALMISAMISYTFAQSKATAEKALTEGNFTQAKRLAEQAINSNRANAIDYAIRGWVALVIEDDLASASVNIKKAVTLEPNNPIALAFFSVIELNAEATKQAAEKALRNLSAPRSALEYFARARAYTNLGKPDEALQDFNEAIELSPQFSSAYNSRGNYYRDKKDYTQAINDFSKAIEFAPNYGFAYSNRGDTYMQLGNSYERAIEDFTKSLALVPNNPGAYLNRGAAYNRSGKSDLSFPDYKKAAELYSRNIEKNPRDTNSLYNRGITYANLQDYARAIEDYSACIQIYPNEKDYYIDRSKAYTALGKDDLAKLDRQKYAALGGILERDNSNARSIYPSVKFDPASAKDALGIGNSTIRGRACSVKDGRVFTAANVRISLYPVTPYLEEWKKLRDKEEDKNTGVYLSLEAAKYRIDLVTDSDGRFQFKEMKSGKYFLQGIFGFNQLKSRDVYSGSDDYTDYYRREDYVVPRSDRLEKTVEVKNDGDVVKITMSKGGGILKIGGACSTW